MKKSVLITGGAGYIGSHTAYMLAQQGYNIIILDKLLHKQSFSHRWAKLIKEDFANIKILEHIFSAYNIEVVLHFAAFIEVGESVIRPRDFYENNVVKTLKLLDLMINNGVKRFIYSSSCSIYGNPVRVPIDEQHPFAPVSPYGKNKLAIEYALEDYARAYGLKYISLRYFNAAGALPEAGLGECHQPETHVIPLLLKSILNKTPFKIFGKNYNTKDGTCIRDYVHVCDIADAHIRALAYLDRVPSFDYFNLGSGKGYTIKELISTAEHVCNLKANITYAERRAGDVDILVADPSKAMNLFGWNPKFSSLEFILKSALRWEIITDAARLEIVI